jgi:hypothetical protein
VVNWKVKPMMDITKSHDSPTGPQLGFLLRWDCYLATFLQLDQFQFAPKKRKEGEGEGSTLGPLCTRD